MKIEKIISIMKKEKKEGKIIWKFYLNFMKKLVSKFYEILHKQQKQMSNK